MNMPCYLSTKATVQGHRSICRMHAASGWRLDGNSIPWMDVPPWSILPFPGLGRCPSDDKLATKVCDRDRVTIITVISSPKF